MRSNYPRIASHGHPRSNALIFAGLVLAACSSCSSCSGKPEIATQTASRNAARAEVAFDDAQPLALQPGEVVRVHVVVSPPATASVRYGLLGDYGDGSLEASVSDTDEYGAASVVLHAPSRPTSFRLRASVPNGNAVERVVSVSGIGFASILVTPRYADSRPISTWRASAHVGTSCASLAGPAYPEADDAVTAAPPSEPMLENIPVGPPVAVVVRADAAVSACVDVAGLSAGEERRITATVSNIPARLSGAHLTFDLGGPTSMPGGWPALLDAWQQRFTVAFFGGVSVDHSTGALLDAMSSAAPAASGGSAAFASARQANAWDTSVDAYLTSTKKDLVARLGEWLTQARHDALAIPGPIRISLVAPEATSASAGLAVSLLFGLPTTVDASPTTVASWSVDLHDRVQVSAPSLSFWPLGLLAQAVATSRGVKSIVDVGPLLSKDLVACNEIAIVITPPNSAAFGNCALACVTSLCESGLAAMWARPISSEHTENRSANINASITGNAHVNADAHVAGVTGRWSGILSIVEGDATNVTLGGSASATREP